MKTHRPFSLSAWLTTLVCLAPVLVGCGGNDPIDVVRDAGTTQTARDCGQPLVANRFEISPTPGTATPSRQISFRIEGQTAPVVGVDLDVYIQEQPAGYWHRYAEHFHRNFRENGGRLQVEYLICQEQQGNILPLTIAINAPDDRGVVFGVVGQVYTTTETLLIGGQGADGETFQCGIQPILTCSLGPCPNQTINIQPTDQPNYRACVLRLNW